MTGSGSEATAGTPRVVTVTLNPSLDRTIEIDALHRGEVHRAGPVRVDAGGKGVNIVRALTRNGCAALAVLVAGGHDGEVLVSLLRAAGVAFRAVPIAADVRTNVSLVEPDGAVTKINTPGATLTAAEIDAVLAATLAAAEGSDWVACSGSLPPGVPDDVYARLVEALHARGCAVAVDTTGPAFHRALAAAPDLVKPNREELAAAVDARVDTLGDVVAAAQTLRDMGAGAVLVSLGEDGAVLVDADGARHGIAPVAAVRSAVGAGDAMLAGFIAGGGQGDPALREALAWGAAAVRLPGSRMPRPVDIDRDTVRLLGPISLQTGAEQ